MKNIFKAFAFAAFTIFFSQISANAEEAAAIVTPVKTEAPSGTYTLDKTHASLTFRVKHLGISNYTARFTRFDTTLNLNTSNPTESTVTATIDPTSIETDYPNPTPDFDAELQNDKWLDTVKFPEMKFTSTKVEMTGDNSAKITGDFGLHGITKTVTMDAVFNGGYTSIPMDPSKSARIGFSAHGSLKRSDFGIAYGIPAPGTNMGVSDDVEFIIEAEFTQPNPKAEEETKK